jgi:hypothetical protein
VKEGGAGSQGDDSINNILPPMFSGKYAALGILSETIGEL